nr:ATP-binding protein [Streptomyces alboflavus]
MVKAQPLVMVTGPSGVGKSSLVAAGLQPELAAAGWAIASFRPGMSPFDAVARALLELEHPQRATASKSWNTAPAPCGRRGSGRSPRGYGCSPAVVSR